MSLNIEKMSDIIGLEPASDKIGIVDWIVNAAK